MTADIFYYVKRKLRTGFDRCCWKDGVGYKYEQNILPDMEKCVQDTADSVEQLLRFLRESEKLLRKTEE